MAAQEGHSAKSSLAASPTIATKDHSQRVDSSYTDGIQYATTQEHSFLMDTPRGVEDIEGGLLGLLDDFKKGKRSAFVGGCSLEKMDQVRDLQERIAQLHFELEDPDSEAGENMSHKEQNRKSHDKLDMLMKNLENLCSTIQGLHQGDAE